MPGTTVVHEVEHILASSCGAASYDAGPTRLQPRGMAAMEEIWIDRTRMADKI
jgi:hypothetical protein